MNNLAQQIQRQKQEKQVVHKKVEHRIRGHVTRGEKFIITAMAAAIIFASLLVVTNFANIYAQDREISALNQSINQQTSTNESLELKVTELSAPDRIMHYAKEELGMELDDNSVRVIQGSAP
ncbi:cell division protein FtsL [Alteribacillus sp. HJP-4]|uniref:cell division protein FtsL n=1 Tax=Alteribacillus sp. HJP-4 TaxID=2775394 RepID=UPI0035CD3C66